MTYVYMYTYTYTYIHAFIYIYIYTMNIYTQVTWSRFKCYVCILNIDCHYQGHFFVREWNDSQYQNTEAGVKVIIIWIVHLKNACFFWETGTPKKFVKNPRKQLLRLASDSPKKKLPADAGNWRGQFFFHRKIPGSLPMLITVSELWEWLFPFSWWWLLLLL